jgi:hypothetical protein
METNYDLYDFDAIQNHFDDKLCGPCEAINGPSCDSKGNMCEGRWCNDAVYYMIDDLLNDGDEDKLEQFLIEKTVAKAHYETYNKLLIRR